jgi:hypothetical protein
MTYLHIKLQLPSSHGSLFLAIKLKVEYGYRYYIPPFCYGSSRKVYITSVTHNKLLLFFNTSYNNIRATCFGSSGPSSGPSQIQKYGNEDCYFITTITKTNEKYVRPK